MTVTYGLVYPGSAILSSNVVNIPARDWLLFLGEMMMMMMTMMLMMTTMMTTTMMTMMMVMMMMMIASWP